jgi:hypothetical protein
MRIQMHRNPQQYCATVVNLGRLRVGNSNDIILFHQLTGKRAPTALAPGYEREVV